MQVHSPITGTVMEIHVTSGGTVERGDALLTVESMKMEIPIESPVDGVIASINVEQGVVIGEGDLLIEIIQ